jgi:hypothetical protein
MRSGHLAVARLARVSMAAELFTGGREQECLGEESTATARCWAMANGHQRTCVNVASCTELSEHV